MSHWLDEASDWRVAYRDSQATIHVRAGRDDCQLAAVGLRPSSWMNHWVRVALPRRVEAIQATIGTKKNG